MGSDGEAGVCRSCGAAIVWARTRHGRPIPIDPDPYDDGNIALVDTADGFLALVNAEAPATTRRYRSHFASCPNAAQHRRARNRRST